MRTGLTLVWAAVLAILAGSPVRAETMDNEPPEITPTPVALPAPGKPLVVECDIADASEIFDPLVYWRTPGAAEYSHSQLKSSGGGHFKTTIPLPKGTREFEYFFEAYDANGNGPARVGTPTKPLKFSLDAATAARSVAADGAGTPVLPVTLLAVGGAGLVASGVFGLLASGDHQSFESTYDPKTRPAFAASVKSESLIADVSLAVGVVAAASGATLWLLRGPSAPAAPEKEAPPSEPEDKDHVVLLPTFNGFAVTGAF